MGKLTIARRDQSGEITSTRLNTPAINVGNLANVVAAAATLEAAMDAICEATVRTRTLSVLTQFPAATAAGNRELKWLLRMTDNVTGLAYSYELGTADDSVPVVSIGGATFLDPASQQWDDLATALQVPSFVSIAGNQMTLVSAELVGRNI